jgi:hypothetical protein
VQVNDGLLEIRCDAGDEFRNSGRPPIALLQSNPGRLDGFRLWTAGDFVETIVLVSQLPLDASALYGARCSCC